MTQHQAETNRAITFPRPQISLCLCVCLSVCSPGARVTIAASLTSSRVASWMLPWGRSFTWSCHCRRDLPGATSLRFILQACHQAAPALALDPAPLPVPQSPSSSTRASSCPKTEHPRCESHCEILRGLVNRNQLVLKSIKWSKTTKTIFHILVNNTSPILAICSCICGKRVESFFW